MASNSTSSPSQRIPYIGQQSIIEELQRVIADSSGKSAIVYIMGDAGMGKTRLLEEIRDQASTWVTNQLVSVTPLIDLYHSDNQTPKGPRKIIRNAVDPYTQNKFFKEYREKLAEYKKVKSNLATEDLRQRRAELDQAFLSGYQRVAEQCRVVILFDTLELVQHENDVVQLLCGVEDHDVLIKEWLIKQVASLPNTVVVFAGRPDSGSDAKLNPHSRSRVARDIRDAFLGNRQNYYEFMLGELSPKDSGAYINNVVAGFPKDMALNVNDVVEPGKRITWRDVILRLSGQRPLYMTLLTELLAYHSDMGDIPQCQNWSQVRIKLIELFENQRGGWPMPWSRIIRYLLRARKGLDEGLLIYLWDEEGTSETPLSPEQARAHLIKAAELTIVKKREIPTGSDQPPRLQLFLHDELYDVFDEMHKSGRDVDPLYRRILEYYRQGYDPQWPQSQQAHWRVAQLFYEFQIDPEHAYYGCYVHWDEESITALESEYDMRLRDETLRFINRYHNEQSLYCNERIQSKIDRAQIDRDCAVRWVNRHRTLGRYRRAAEIAETLRWPEKSMQTQPEVLRLQAYQLLDWEQTTDVLYKGGLLVAWGSAVINVDLDKALEMLTEARKVLLPKHDQRQSRPPEAITNSQRWLWERTTGRAHKWLGYYHRMRGNYAQAAELYRRALAFFRRPAPDDRMKDEDAETTNNLAFALALLGNGGEALTNAERALRTREQLEYKSSLGLSYNSLAHIHALQTNISEAEVFLQKAENTFNSVNSFRGKMMAAACRGFVMRRKGELWKRNPDDPERYARATTAYEEGAKVLIDALAQMDPNKRGYEATRHWEMQNELASIYCDWGWMTWQAGGLSAAYDLYQQSVKTQTEALNFARTRKYIFQTADSLDDLAQAKGDLSYLLARNNQLEESQKWRVEAKQHLAEVMNDIVPASQHLGGDSMSSDLIADVRSESYWQCLGKAHLWLGIWGARDLELKLASEQIAPAVFEDFMKSETYFAAYSGATSAFLQRTESYIAHFLELRLLQPSAIQGYIQAFQTQYKVQLSGLSQLVDNVLGYYDW